MLRQRALLLALAFVGLLKAGAVVWAGATLGLSPWVVTTAAAAWALAPAAAGWVWARRRDRAVAQLTSAVAEVS